MHARYLIGSDESVPVTDRGIAYGDGLFETMAIAHGAVARLSLHRDRLSLGCRRLGIPAPEWSELNDRIKAAIGGIVSGTLKLILTRGSGPRGYRPPDQIVPTIILLPADGRPAPAPDISVAMLSQRLGENENLAGIKHLCRLEQVLGQLELEPLDAEEGLMLSTHGAVIGGTSRNLFIVSGEAIRTPRIDRAGIAGVMRRAVIEQCLNDGIEITEAEISAGELVEADELFMTNALVGIQSVRQLDARTFNTCEMASRLRRALGLTDPETASET